MNVVYRTLKQKVSSNQMAMLLPLGGVTYWQFPLSVYLHSGKVILSVSDLLYDSKTLC